MRLGFMLVLIVSAVGMAVADRGLAQQTDMHDLFESRCLSCHGHSGDFARNNLMVTDNEVVGSRGQSLTVFLARHQGGLSPDETRQLLEMFRKQIESGASYQQRCLTCHGTAREFARLNLILRDNVLFGRYTGREVAPFLVGHARLSDVEAVEMTEVLAAILQGGR